MSWENILKNDTNSIWLYQHKESGHEKFLPIKYNNYSPEEIAKIIDDGTLFEMNSQNNYRIENRKIIGVDVGKRFHNPDTDVSRFFE